MLGGGAVILATPHDDPSLLENTEVNNSLSPSNCMKKPCSK